MSARKPLSGAFAPLATDDPPSIPAIDEASIDDASVLDGKLPFFVATDTVQRNKEKQRKKPRAKTLMSVFRRPYAERDRLLASQPPPPIVVPSVGSKVGWWVREFAAALMCGFFIEIFSATFASTLGTHSTFLAKKSGTLVHLATLSFVVGTPRLIASKSSYAQPDGVDIAFAPLLAQLADGIESAFGPPSSSDDDAKFAAWLCALALTSLLAGLALLAMSRYRLLDIAEYVPSAVVFGLVASISAMLCLAAYRLAGEDPHSQVAALALLLAEWALGRMRWPMRVSPWVRILCTTAVPTLLFYAIPIEGRAGWLLPTHRGAALLSTPPLFRAFEEARSGGLDVLRTGLVALARCLETAGAIAVVVLLKAPIWQEACKRQLEEPPDSSAEVQSSDELSLLGCSTVFGVLVGCPAILCQQLALSSIAKFLGAGAKSKIAGVGAVVLALGSAVLGKSSLGLAAAVPRFVFAALVGSQGISLLDRWLLVPARVLPRNEFAVTCVIVAVTLTNGVCSALGVGAVASVLLFAWSSTTAPVVKYIATAQTFRSNVERDAVDVAYLDAEGGRIAILIVQGFLFFGNGRRLLEFVEAVLPKDENEKPAFVVIDCAHAIGADSSAVDSLVNIARRVARRHDVADLKKHGPPLYLSGAHDDFLAALRRRKVLDENHEHNNRGSEEHGLIRLVVDLDRALGACETRLLEEDARAMPKKKRPKVGGFAGALALCAGRTSLARDKGLPELLATLQRLEPFAKEMQLQHGDELLSHHRIGQVVSEEEDALFFVARGKISVRHDPQQSTKVFIDPFTARPLLDSHAREPRTTRGRAFRLAELGPGSLVGAEELATKTRCAGIFEAAGDCLLYRLGFEDLERLDAKVHAALFRLVAANLAEDCERLKVRISSFVDALYSKPLRKPVHTRTLRAIATFT